MIKLNHSIFGAMASLAILTPVASAHNDDTKTVAELKAIVEKNSQAWATGDLAPLKASIAEQIWGAWDSDMAGRPIAWASKGDVFKFFDTMLAEMKKMGGSTKSETKKLDCHASGDLGVCMHEAVFTMSMPKMPPMSMGYRETEVFHKEKTGWRAVHHHGSLATAPEMPKQFFSFNSKSAKWQDMPGMPGVKMSPMWMNSATQAFAAMVKVGPEGMKHVRHFHPYATTGIVMEGSITTTDVSGKDATLAAGSVFYRAPNEPHTTSMAPNSVAFMVMDGPFAMINVDEQGKPVHAER